MSDIYGAYADYYDLIYGSKDYQAEADKVASLLSRHSITEGSILELGCGTGRHAIALSGHGYDILGVDLSENMLGQARKRLAQHPGLETKISLHQGDVTSVRLEPKVAAVVSLFHVMCYKKTDDALSMAAATAAAHLDPGGIFLFDLWYGPAVLADPPVVRVKRVSDDALTVTRIAEPHIHPEKNIVKVHYDIFAKRPAEPAWSNFHEIHAVRYLFEADILRCLTENGFEVEGIHDWETDGQATEKSWNAYCIARLK